MLEDQLRWRREALRLTPYPAILCEVAGGWGQIGRALYRDYDGVVIEKQALRAHELATQRPTWSVYQGRAVSLVQAGVGRHHRISYLDIATTGSPWPIVHAWMTSDRPHVDHLVIVATDPSYRMVKMGRAWTVEELRPVVMLFGNTTVKESYGEVCETLLALRGEVQGYTLDDFRFGTSGKNGQIAHWIGVLRRRNDVGEVIDHGGVKE